MYLVIYLSILSDQKSVMFHNYSFVLEMCIRDRNKVKVVRAERKVDMNFSQLGKIQELKGHMDTFRRNHPKFPMFLGAVAQNAVEEGTIIEINVTAPNGAHYETNLKLRAEDLEFIRALQEMGK